MHAPSLLDNNFNPIPNTVEEYVDSTAKYFNDAWTYEIDTLGYDAPPFMPGENYYDVYIQEQGTSTYGYTQLVNIINGVNPPLFKPLNLEPRKMTFKILSFVLQ